MDYFAQIPNTSPARYNHPYQHLSTLFNWAINQDYLRKNPITAQGLKKKRDDGNIKPASIDDVKTLLDSFNRKEYTGFRNYVLTLVMLDTGIRTSEIVQLKNEDYNATTKQITIRKGIAKAKRNRVAFLSPTTAAALNSFNKIKSAGWSEYLFPSREGE